MLKILIKIKDFFYNKNIILIIVMFFCVFVLFLGVKPALAASGDQSGLMVAIVTVIGWIAFLISYVIGYIATVAISVLIWVAQFNNIIGVDAVVKGWVVVRDLCNMFFILILLVIAFATILRIPNYEWKKLLPKLLIMAVLINFSKTICGLIIDFSQVIMLTFVNGFATTGTARFVDMFQMQKYGSLTGVNDAAFTGGSAMAVAAGIIMGVFAMLVSVIVILVMLGVLVMRVIMLWVYTILSPIAFLAAAFPAGQKYSSQWWGEFSKNVIVGPVLAFFIWLALLTAGTSSNDLSTSAGKSLNVTGGSTISVSGEVTSPNALFSTTNFQSYIITLALLIGGLMVTQQMGGAMASIAGKGMAAIQKGGAITGKTAMLPLLGVKTLAGFGIDKLHQKKGVDLNLGRAWETLQARRAEKRKERYAEGQVVAGRAMTEGGRTHGLLAMTGSPGDAWDEITHTEGIVPRGIMQRLWGGRKLRKEAGAIEPDLVQAEFESKFMGANSDEKIIEHEKLKSRASTIDREIEDENDKREKKDENKINDLNKQKETINKQLVFAGSNISKTFSPEQQDEARSNAEEMRKQYNKYKPRVPFEARSAEQSVVAAKMSKIKDISAPTELLRILQDAIKQHDKTMIKAVTLKMTRDANDNEFLQPLAGDTSHLGLKKLMREFSTKGSKNYAGFGKQEAFGLGSQIAELNKATNHWAATSSYLMENGRWRETTNSEHAEIRTAETGKLHMQQLVRVVNRLGFGKHTGSGSYELDVGGLITLKQIDNPGGIKQLTDNMTESTAKYLHANIDMLRKTGEFSPELLEGIEYRAKSVTAGSFDEKFERVSGALEKAKTSS